jgi:hypothetical protein
MKTDLSTDKDQSKKKTFYQTENTIAFFKFLMKILKKTLPGI